MTLSYKRKMPRIAMGASLAVLKGLLTSGLNCPNAETFDRTPRDGNWKDQAETIGSATHAAAQHWCCGSYGG